MHWFLSVTFLGLLLAPSASAAAYKSFDGFSLSIVTDKPKGSPKGIIVFVHGPDRFADASIDYLAPIKASKNLYAQLAKSLVSQGYATTRSRLRWDQFQKLKKDKLGKIFQSYRDDPVHFLVSDVEALVDYTEKQFPKVPITILGYGKGSYIALQAAARKKSVERVVLLGIVASTLRNHSLVQTLSLAQSIFRATDVNRDGKLSLKEMKASPLVDKLPSNAVKIVDLNGDKHLDLSEYQAAWYTTVIQDADQQSVFAESENKFSSVSEILKSIKTPVLILQGEEDQTTPAFGAKALELMNVQQWKNQAVTFQYIKGVGGVQDLLPPSISKESLDSLAQSSMAFTK
jgi:pimeloyl-ACP methyl ester carboxylesterase